MDKSDRAGFFETPKDLSGYLIAEYVFEFDEDPEDAAAHLASEMSTAQWKRVGVKEDLRGEFGAKIIHFEVNTKCHIKIAYPVANLGSNIPALLTALAGEGAFFAPGITFIKLVDIEFPENYLKTFKGPKFGTAGIRKLLNIHDRPIFFGVIKPNIGLSPKDFSEIAYEAWSGGLDVAKDDELIFDVSYSPFGKRTEIMGKKRVQAEKETGSPKAYLANITDEVDKILELHDTAVKNGANMVMLNSMTVGLSAVRMLAKHTKVPIVGHFDFIAPFTRVPYFGLTTKLITKLQRLAGCDAIIMPGFGKRMRTSDEEVLENVLECVKPFGNIKPILPVPGGSDWAGTLQPLYEKIGIKDFGFVPGRGVFAHPGGPKGGAISLHQAWEAISKGIDPKDYCDEHPELARAFDAFNA